MLRWRSALRSLVWPAVGIALAGPLLLAGAAVWLHDRAQLELAERAATDRLEAIAELIITQREEPDPAVLQSLRIQARRLEAVRGPVPADGPDGRDRPDRPASREPDTDPRDVYLARNFGRGQAVQTIDGTVWLSLTRRVEPDDGPAWLLRLRTRLGKVPSWSRPRDALSGAGGWFWGCLLAVELLAGSVAFLFWRRVRRPVVEVARGLDRLSRFQWDQQVSLPARAAEDELGQLGEAFNAAVQQLQQRFQEQQSRGTELERAARFLETVLSTMIEGVVVVDSQHHIQYANPAAAGLLGSGFRPVDMTGRPFLEVVRQPAIQQTLERVIRDEDRVRVEVELPRQQRTLSIFAARIHSTTSPGAVLVLHDVTELRRLENLRREFVSNVSHELKTPLAAIQACVETLLGGAVDDPEFCRRFLTRIEEQSNRLHELIQDLLQLARIESGTEAFDIQNVSVAETVLACVDEEQPVAAGRGLRISLEAPATDLFVRADPRGLRTILDNLVGNAVKYTPESGQVRVRWEAEPDQPFVRIDVIDNGPGIPKERLTRIFERFYRIDQARSRPVGGTGLGLSIVKHLTQVFGGSVSVRSEVGTGSTFTVRLPQA